MLTFSKIGNGLQRARHFLVAFGLVVITACSLPALQQGTANTAAALQQAQATSNAIDPQIAALKAQLAQAPSKDQVSALQAQVDALNKQLASASTQPDQAAQVQSLTSQIAALKLQLAMAPNSDAIAKLQQQITDLQLQKAKADAYLATLTTAANQAAGSAANATTANQAAGGILVAAATPAATIPTWGWAISLGLSLIGNWLLAGKAQQNAQAATSIAQSIAVATQAGQMTVTPAALNTLSAIQTPTARALIDEHQAATDSPSLGDLVPAVK